MTERVLIFGKDKDTLDLEAAHVKDCDFQSGGGVRAVAVVPVYWNPDTLSFEWQTKASISGVDLGDLEPMTSGTYWRKTLYEYDVDANLIYKAYHTTYNAVDSDAYHYIIKYTYSSGNLVKKQLAVGAWTNRANLGW